MEPIFRNVRIFRLSMLRQRHLFMFYDFEATSNDPTEDHIISIGAVICEVDHGFQNPVEFHTYVHTSRPINPVAEAIHNIHASDLAGKPSFPEALKLWKEWILEQVDKHNGTILLIGGHNSNKFDGLILFCNCRFYRVDYDQFLLDIHVQFTFDTLTMLREIFGRRICDAPKNQATQKPSYKLGDCYHSFCGKPLEGAHNALTDARALYDIFCSETVRRTFTIPALWPMMKTIQNYNRDIKKTCGSAHEAITHRTRLEEIRLSDEPILDDDEHLPERMCLNCMTLVKVTEHLKCVIPAISLRKTNAVY